MTCKYCGSKGILHSPICKVLEGLYELAVRIEKLEEYVKRQMEKH